MDHQIIIETRNDHEALTTADNTRDSATPLHKSNSLKSLPSPTQIEVLEREIEREFDVVRLPFKQAVTEPRTRPRRGMSADLMALRASRLFQEEDDDDDDCRDVGLRQRKQTDRRKSKSPDAPRRRSILKPPRAHQSRPRAPWLISAEHPLKVMWDVITVILSIANAYATHVSIRDRKYDSSPFNVFCTCWFLLDILLNFVTERKTVEGDILRDYRSIAARYLTSWFAVDALSLFPWETLYVKPIIDLQNRRGFFRKSFFRSKAVVRVITHLRGKHFGWFGTALKHTKHHGIGASRLIRLSIKYLPKYILFLRNMKGIVAMRVLRQINYLRRFYTNVLVDEKGDEMTESLTRQDEVEDDLSSSMSLGVSRRRVQVVYENWEMVEDNDDDDGVPL